MDSLVKKYNMPDKYGHFEEFGGKYVPEMIGVIEAPINKMMKAYPDEFSFMRHTTRRDRDLEKKGKS